MAWAGVVDAGPFKQRFLRDAGCAFLVVGGAYAWFAFDTQVRAAALAAAAFLTLHALMHDIVGLASRERARHLVPSISQF